VRGHTTYLDTVVPGPELRVAATAVKSWSIRYRADGRRERITIGTWPDVDIGEARDRARQIRGQVASGSNPAEEERSLRAEITLGELYSLYLQSYAKQHLRPRTVSDIEYYWRYLRPWAHRALSSISRADVQALHAQVGSEVGPYEANRTHSWLRAMINVAIRQWGWSGSNPATGIRRFREQKRTRFLKPEELARFFTALSESESEVTRDFVWLALLTGARKSNLLSMRFDQLNLSTPGAETWTIPAEAQKSGEEQVVPLHPLAVAILRRRRQTTDGEWVLPGRRPGTHLREPKTAWCSILKRAGLGRWEGTGKARRFVADLRIHDLRRSLGSWRVGTGANLPVVGATLGHHDPAATAVYACVDLDPVRSAIGKAIDAMLEVGGVAGNVVELEPPHTAVADE
jgi:integrase